MTTPAGWYPDPSGQPGQRYFDGTNWTEHRAQPQSKKAKKGIILGSIGAVLALFLLIGVASGGEDEEIADDDKGVSSIVIRLHGRSGSCRSRTCRPHRRSGWVGGA